MLNPSNICLLSVQITLPSPPNKNKYLYLILILLASMSLVFFKTTKADKSAVLSYTAWLYSTGSDIDLEKKKVEKAKLFHLL